MDVNRMTQEDGFDLFMRFADGCRCYLKDRGIISEEDNQSIVDYFRTGSRPSMDVVKRVYYIALPRLEEAGQESGKGVFDPESIRRFYAYDHNKMKVEQKEYACIAFPAKVIEKNSNEFFIELSPIQGRFWVQSDIDLSAGDWLIVPRINVIEKIPEEYAKEVSGQLIKYGMNKDMKFPKNAIKYLKELKRCQG
ncbi:MAG: hypothetical protein KAT15_22695 [Bacteroidales bacterium]|nr:hypothetical protein [Bacteroidales bacterium]